MADPLDSGDDVSATVMLIAETCSDTDLLSSQIFDRLKKGVDPKLQEEKTKRANERQLAQFEKAQRRLGELVYHRIISAQTYKSVWHIG